MLKKNGLLVFMILLVGLLLIALFNKDKLNNYISREMQKQTEADLRSDVEEFIKKNYNYINNEQEIDFTLLEFSSRGCVMCKQMETVLEEIKASKKAKVNVAFLHIMKAENQDLMKYYGISAVPMQILLDKTGKEFFRHYGVITTADLENKFLQQKRLRQ